MNSPLHDKKILVIDPSEPTRSMLKQHLERQGSVVYTVGVPDKIRSIIQGTDQNGMAIDVIIVDVNLPESFGFYPLKLVTSSLQGRKVPILLISSGFQGGTVREVMKNWGIVGHLRKPFLISTFDQFLKNRLEVFDARNPKAIPNFTQKPENALEDKNEATKDKAKDPKNVAKKAVA